MIVCMAVVGIALVARCIIQGAVDIHNPVDLVFRYQAVQNPINGHSVANPFDPFKQFRLA
jgi:hypothetical protein